MALAAEMDPNERWLTPRQAAALLGVSVSTVRRLPIPRAHFGYRTVRFKQRDVVAFGDRNSKG